MRLWKLDSSCYMSKTALQLMTLITVVECLVEDAVGEVLLFVKHTFICNDVDFTYIRRVISQCILKLIFRACSLVISFKKKGNWR